MGSGEAAGRGGASGMNRRAVPAGVLLFGAALVGGCGASRPQGAAGVGGGGATFANPVLVVAPEGLVSRRPRDAGTLVVVDARPAADFSKGHLPGAVSLPASETFDPARDKNYPDRPERLAALFGARGIGAGRRVLTYDNGGETPAARLLWTLEYLGHSDVAVLDGGVRGWQAAGGELTQNATDARQTTFRAAVDAARLHGRDDCLRHVGDRTVGTVGTVAMVDARSAEEYRGEDVRAKFGGHIPEAVNVDWRLVFDESGRLKSPVALAALYQARGITRERGVVAYCQTGQRSSVSYWTLRLLGYPRVANYAGSWVEWGNDPATPKAQGG